jgi:hypothetical protein
MLDGNRQKFLETFLGMIDEVFLPKNNADCSLVILLVELPSISVVHLVLVRGGLDLLQLATSTVFLFQTIPHENTPALYQTRDLPHSEQFLRFVEPVREKRFAVR